MRYKTRERLAINYTNNLSTIYLCTSRESHDRCSCHCYFGDKGPVKEEEAAEPVRERLAAVWDFGGGDQVVARVPSGRRSRGILLSPGRIASRTAELQNS